MDWRDKMHREIAEKVVWKLMVDAISESAREQKKKQEYFEIAKARILNGQQKIKELK